MDVDRHARDELHVFQRGALPQHDMTDHRVVTLEEAQVPFGGENVVCELPTVEVVLDVAEHLRRHESVLRQLDRIAHVTEDDLAFRGGRQGVAEQPPSLPFGVDLPLAGDDGDSLRVCL